MRFKYLLLSALSLSLLNATAQSHLKTGIWRGELKTQSGNLLPFNFDVKDTADKQQIFIHNAAERFKVTDIRQQGDSVFIHMPLFNSEFKLKYEGPILKGQWIKHYGDRDAAMDFTASAGIGWRFFNYPDQPKFNVGGRWTAIFGEAGKKDTTV